MAFNMENISTTIQFFKSPSNIMGTSSTHSLLMVMVDSKAGLLQLLLSVPSWPLLLQSSLSASLLRKSRKTKQKKKKPINKRIPSLLKKLNKILKRKILNSSEKANIIKKPRINSSKKPKLFKMY